MVSILCFSPSGPGGLSSILHRMVRMTPVTQLHRLTYSCVHDVNKTTDGRTKTKTKTKTKEDKI